MSVALGPILRAFYSGAVANGATCNVYQSGTTTPVTIYSDAALTTPTTNPATADSNGEFSFYVASAYNLRLVINTSTGTLIRDVDPYYPAVVDVKGATIASASTTDIGSATGNFVDISGTTTITALGTAPAGAERTVRFTGALTLTYNASSLILPGAANITTANGDTAIFKSLGGGNWICIIYVKASGIALVIGSQGTDVASATTTPIGGATGDFINITGTTTITAFDSAAAGLSRVVKFTGALTLTYNATSLILPGAINITTAAGDTAIFRSLGSGNWLCIAYIPANGENVNTRKTTLASAATVNIGAAACSAIDISGTTTITAFDSVAAGILRTIRFTGALTLTYNATSLILPGAANITTANGDVATFYSLGSGNWVCANYTKASGIGGVYSNIAQQVNTQTGAMATGTTTITLGDSIPTNTQGDQYMTQSITPKNSNNKLIIDVVIFGAYTVAAVVIAALFQDSTANALAVGDYNTTSTNQRVNIAFRYIMTAGTTSSTTFKIRVGANTAGTFTFNGQGSAREFGGVLASSITITEIGS